MPTPYGPGDPRPRQGRYARFATEEESVDPGPLGALVNALRRVLPGAGGRASAVEGPMVQDAVRVDPGAMRQEVGRQMERARAAAGVRAEAEAKAERVSGYSRRRVNLRGPTPEQVPEQYRGQVGETVAMVDNAEARRTLAVEDAIRADWQQKPAVQRHAVAAAEGVLEGVTAGHPELLASDDKIEAFRKTPLSAGEQASRVVGLVGGAAGTIGVQNAVGGALAPGLPERLRAALAAVVPRSTLARGALEGVPYDLLQPADSFGDRVGNATLGTAGALAAGRLLGGHGASGSEALERSPSRVEVPGPEDVADAFGAVDEARAPALAGGRGKTLNAGIPPRALLDAVTSEAGRATVGGAAGAAVGGAIGGDEEWTTGALTGAMVGAQLGRYAKWGGKKARGAAQLAGSDPDVQAVLAASQPPRGPSPEPGTGGAVKRALTDLRDKASGTGRRLYQSVVDDVYGLRRFGREVGGTETPSVEASRMRGWAGWADELVGLRKPGTAPGHPTLRAAIEAAKGREQDVVALLNSERALELAEHGMPNKGLDLQVAQSAVEKLSQVPEVREAADKLRSFYNYLLELRWRNGLLDDETYNRVRAEHQFYTPFVRDFPADPEEEGVVGGLRRLFNRDSGVRKMDDGEASAPIADPFETAVLDAQQTAKDVSRQRVMQSVAAIVEQNPDGAADFIRRVPPESLKRGTDGREYVTTPLGAQGRVIEAVVDGKRAFYEVVDDDLYSALSSVGPTANGIFRRIVNVLSLPSQGLRSGVTSMPSFGAANAMRDAFYTSLAYPNPVRNAAGGAVAGGVVGAATDDEDRVRGFLRGAGFGVGGATMLPHAYRIANGLRHVVGNDEVYQSFLREGGAGSGFFAPTRKEARQAVAQLQRDGVPLSSIVNPRSWWDAIQVVNRYVEEAPRVARFAHALEEGQTPGVAAFEGRDVSLDFSRGGADTKTIRSLSAFWNPAVLGLDKLTRVLSPKNPQAYAVGLAAMTAPTLALWSVNKDDPEYWRRPLYERNFFWLVPVGQDGEGTTRFLRVPKPFDVGLIFASLPERALDYAYQRDPERALEALRDMGVATASAVLPVPTFAQAPLENYVNYDAFRHKPVEGWALQDLPVTERYDADTSAPAIALSKALDLGTFGAVQVGPEKIDHMVEGYLGTMGVSGAQLATDVARGVGLDRRPPSVDERRGQFERRFLTRSNGFGTDDVQALFRRYESANARRERWDELLEEGEVDAADAYYQKHAEEIERAMELEPAAKSFRQLARERRRIERDENLTVEERRAMIADLGSLAADLAQDAVGGRRPAGPLIPGGKAPAYAEPRREERKGAGRYRRHAAPGVTRP